MIDRGSWAASGFLTLEPNKDNSWSKMQLFDGVEGNLDDFLFSSKEFRREPYLMSKTEDYLESYGMIKASDAIRLQKEMHKDGTIAGFNEEFDILWKNKTRKKFNIKS